MTAITLASHAIALDRALASGHHGFAQSLIAEMREMLDAASSACTVERERARTGVLSPDDIREVERRVEARRADIEDIARLTPAWTLHELHAVPEAGCHLCAKGGGL